jgi:uncharacterized protein
VLCQVRSIYSSFTHLSGLSIGLDKGGLPGVAALGMAFALSAPLSDSSVTVGHVLAIFVPVLSLADLGAVYKYSQFIQWNIVKQLSLPILLGLALGFYFLGSFSDHLIRLLAGTALLLLALFHLFLPSLLIIFTGSNQQPLSLLPFSLPLSQFNENQSKISFKKWIPGIVSLKFWIFGVSIGSFTIISNIAGPIVVAFLIQMNLPKDQLNGTRSCLFLLINCLKIPIQIWLGNIHPEDMTIIAMLCSIAIVITFLTASYLMPYLHQQSYVRLTWILVIVCAVDLIRS